MKIDFAFVPVIVCATAHGPIWAAVACVEEKIISPKFWLRIVASIAINQLVFSLLLNSYWLWSAGFIGRDVPYITCVIARIPQTAVLIPVQVIVTPVLLRIVKILRKQKLIPQYS